MLIAAGIPSTVTMEDFDDDGEPNRDFKVMVPGALALKAAAVLDVHVFNPEQEAIWRTHLEGLTDRELQVLRPSDICAGLRDRIERLTRAYHEELERRGLASGDSKSAGA